MATIKVRYFELAGTPARFLRAWQSRRAVGMQEGTLGEGGTVTFSGAKEWRSQAKAAEALANLVAERLAAGWVEKPLPPAGPPASTSARQVTRRSFEFVGGASSKFWEVWVDGSEVLTRYGKTGAQGQTTIKQAGSPAAARMLHDTLVKEKTRKGYVEKTGGLAPTVHASASPARPARASRSSRGAPARSRT